MKRFVALLLVCCLLVSSLCVTAFAADDSITGKAWSCATAGKSISIPKSSGSASAGVYSPVVDSSSSYPVSSYRFTAGQDFILTDGTHSYYWQYLNDQVFVDASGTYAADGYMFYKDGVAPNRYYNDSYGVMALNSVERLSQLGYSSNAFDFVSGSSGNSLRFCSIQCSNGSARGISSFLSNYRNFVIDAQNARIEFVSDGSDIPAVSSSISYTFDASLAAGGGFGTSPIEEIYETFPGWSGISRNTAQLCELPAATSIYSSVTVSVDGFSGFGSESTMPKGSMKVYSVDLNGHAKDLLVSFPAISPTVSGESYLFNFSSAVSLLKSVNTYSASLFYVFTLEGNDGCPLDGKTITCNVSRSSIYVKTLAPAVSESDKNIEETTKDIYETVISNNAAVIQKLTSIYDRLKDIGLDTASIKSLMQQLVTAINGMGADLDAVLTYLENTKSQIAQLASLLQTIADKLQVNIDSLTSILTELVAVGADVKLCVTYLTGISNSIGILGGTVEEMRGYLETNTQTLRDILSAMLTFDDFTRGKLRDILDNLVSQGADLSTMKSALAAIQQNTAQANELLSDLLEELQKVEAANTETNDRLKAIQKAIDDFEVNLNQTVNNVMSESDKKGFSGLISKLVNRLLSVVDFVGDLFGDVFTSIPSTISAFNECNSFWNDSKTYVYTPHQLSGFTGQGGAGYENSNESVQLLFTEAEKYLGFPYVFGGSSPETSFDCSGFVCYALNQSGVYSIARTTAQGLYDVSTKISEADAMPGDLIFFTGTYNSGSAVSHVGIYAGDGRMLHCGDPIQYESFKSSYWQSHLYGFGRLPYNSSAG